MVDLSEVSGTMSGMDSYTLGETASRIWRNLRIAFVYRGTQINKFFENVTVNRGVQTIIVQDVNLALEWLIGSAPNKSNAGGSD